MVNFSISTHAPRVRRDAISVDRAFLSHISTHAPRVRRDLAENVLMLPPSNFYSRASCEARLGSHKCSLAAVNFYSRASCEARRKTAGSTSGIADFYSRASCEARPGRRCRYRCKGKISTHAPRVRRDFYDNLAHNTLEISTHAPRVRRDRSGEWKTPFEVFLLTRLV